MEHIVSWEPEGRYQYSNYAPLTLKAPEKLQLYGLYVYYVVHICDFGMLRVKNQKGAIAVQSLWQ